MRRLLVLAVVFVVGNGILSQPSHAQSDDAIATQFVGIWRLVSWSQRLADGTTRQSPLSVGYIIYTDTNRMCYVSMAPNRPAWKSETAPTESEALSGMGNPAFYAYCAGVEVHPIEGFVLHHVEIDKVPNLVGRTRKRWFTFDGPNRVMLRIDPSELGPPLVESTLTWERVLK
jgi:hypothetical protein